MELKILSKLVSFLHLITIANINDEAYLYENGAEFSQTHMTKAANVTYKNLSHIVSQERIRGGTALGAGAVIAVALAGNIQNGATVVLCTDGQSMSGVGTRYVYGGDPNPDERVTKFHEDLADYANEHGVTINLLSLKG